MSERALPPPSHETGDVSFRLVAWLLVLAGVLLLLLIGMAAVMFSGEVKDARFTLPFPEWPSPKLQTDAAEDMRQFHAEEMDRLNRAGWEDRASNTIHIPIDQAMRAVVAEG